MAERLTNKPNNRLENRDAIDQIALATVAKGGSLSEVIEALTAVGITIEGGKSVYYRLEASGYVELNPNFGLQLTEQGQESLELSEDNDTAHSLAEITVERRQQMNKLGQSLIERFADN